MKSTLRVSLSTKNLFTYCDHKNVFKKGIRQDILKTNCCPPLHSIIQNITHVYNCFENQKKFILKSQNINYNDKIENQKLIKMFENATELFFYIYKTLYLGRYNFPVPYQPQCLTATMYYYIQTKTFFTK